MVVFNQILDPLLHPLLDATGPFWTLFSVSLFVSLLTTLVYKFTTDQTRLKQLKADMRRYQKKLSANKNNPEKALKIQKDMMKLNGELMRQSLKSTLYTFLPILLFFGWMQANLAFAPLLPNESFNVTVSFNEGVVDKALLVLPDELSSNSSLSQVPLKGVISWQIIGPSGLYDASIQIGDEEHFFSILISDAIEYVDPVNQVKDSSYIDTITLSNDKLRVFLTVPGLNSLPWIKNLNWFWAYFLFSIIFSMTLRKVLKIA